LRCFAKRKVSVAFLKKYGTKLTSKHFFLHAVDQLLFQFLWINALVDGDKIIVKKYINLGLATDLLSGDLMVP